MQCLILAGGLGTRMYPRSQSVPKCLIEVAGRPFAHWQLDWLASEGIEDVVFSIGHLGEMVRAEIGDGSRWGVTVTYVDEGERRAGTGGALRLAVERGALAEEFFVLYGDSYLTIDIGAVEASFVARRSDALMTVYRNEGRWEPGNVVFRDGMVTRYEKGVTPTPPDMQFVDYGLCALRAAVVVEIVPPGRPSDLADALGTLSRQGRLAGFEAAHRFFEIGTPAGLADLERHLAPSSHQAHRGE